MDYEGINSAVCEAEESDWLDISYTERKYIDQKSAKKQRARKEKSARKPFGGKVWRVAVVAVLCVAVLATMLLLDGDFKKEVFAAVKTAATTIFTRTENKTENKINIPCNITLQNVENGVMTFSGGKAAVSFIDGKVTGVTEDSVTVSIDEDTAIVYSGLESVFVKASDEVDVNTLLGKYNGEFSASILENGQVVQQVVGSDTQLVWSI